MKMNIKSERNRENYVRRSTTYMHHVMLLSRKVRRSGHVANMDKRNAYEILAGKHQGDIPFGRHRILPQSLRCCLLGSEILQALRSFCHHHVWNSRAHQRMDLNCWRWQLT